MKLYDSVTIIEAGEGEDDFGNPMPDWGNPTTLATLPAEVQWRSTGITFGVLSATVTDKLVAICPWYDFDPNVCRLQWQGHDYQVDGSVLEHRRHGAPHHMTVPLLLVG